MRIVSITYAAFIELLQPAKLIGGPLSRRVGWRRRWAPHAVSSRSPETPSLRGKTDHGLCAPVLHRNRALLVGICLDQARVDRKAFPTRGNARFDDPLEHPAENVPFTKTPFRITRKRQLDPAYSIDLRIFRAPSRFSSASPAARARRDPGAGPTVLAAARAGCRSLAKTSPRRCRWFRGSGR
ncbi:hypothetical protein M2427_008559 [Bradyrhizobium sp. BR13661]|jgi:hypothetical protein|nr:hypothetical protein [Bradyrhizobium sp. BR13661]